MADVSKTPRLKWSAQLSAHTRDDLPGDKIILPPSALEALLEATSDLARENSRRDLPAYDPYNSSTFAAFQRAESEYQDNRRQLPQPLTFRLVNPDNGHVVYAGVREFSAEGGEVVLSKWISESLGISEETAIEKIKNEEQSELNNSSANGDNNDSKVTVHVCELPKGTFVKLRPLEASTLR